MKEFSYFCKLNSPLAKNQSKMGESQQTQVTSLIGASLADKPFEPIIYKILNSGEMEPLKNWMKQVRNGSVKRVFDQNENWDKFSCINLSGSNIGLTYISTPPLITSSLAVHLPELVIKLKNMKRFFLIEVSIVDDRKIRRRFRFSNYPMVCSRRDLAVHVPTVLVEGWQELVLNLREMTMCTWGTKYISTSRVQIHPNVRLREIFFRDSPSEKKDDRMMSLMWLMKARKNAMSDGLHCPSDPAFAAPRNLPLGMNAEASKPKPSTSGGAPTNFDKTIRLSDFERPRKH